MKKKEKNKSFLEISHEAKNNFVGEKFSFFSAFSRPHFKADIYLGYS
jgi:hypothetical protein